LASNRGRTGRWRLLAALIAAAIGATLPGACGGKSTSAAADATADGPPVQPDASIDAIVADTESDAQGDADVTTDVAMTEDAPAGTDGPMTDSLSGGPCDAPGTVTCDCTTPLICTDAGTWQYNSNAGCRSETFGCFQGRCVFCQPGATTCWGNALATCSADGSGFSQQVPCVNQSCFPGGPCVASTCVGVCVANSERCVDSTTYQKCDWSGTWSMPQVCPTQVCLGSGCTLCVPNALECNGLQPVQCAADGSGLHDVGAACSQPTPECNQGACTCSGITCGGQCVYPLTDDQNCGGCGIVCNGACLAGQCITVLASGLPNPSDIRVNATNVYWNDQDATGGYGTIMTVPLGGGTPTTLASDSVGSSTQPPIVDIDIDSSNIYWVASTGADNIGCGVFKTPLAGGASLQLVPPVGLDVPQAVHAFGSWVYWTSMRVSLFAVPIAGGATQTLSSGGTSLVNATAVVADGSAVYWGTSGRGVLSVPVGGGSATTIATGSPWRFALDASNVYWTDTGNNGVMQAPRAGGSATTLAAGQGAPWGIAVDTKAVYWAAGGSIYSVPIGGGTETTYASGASPRGVAVDATYIYWVNIPGAIMRVAK
jgi:hypothetical protein